MSKVEEAVSCFVEGFSCSQAILSTYCTEFGLDREKALKIATGFGGGMGRLGRTCGTVTGAIMVIGLKYGITKIEDIGSKEKTYELVREYVDSFKNINNSTICNKLLDCDINTPEGMRRANDNNLFKTLCPDFVRSSAEILEKLL